MKPFLTLVLMSAISTGIAFADTVNFDDLKVGAPPPGWTATRTGTGDVRDWCSTLTPSRASWPKW